VAAYEAELAERRRLWAEDARLTVAIAQMESASPVGRIKHWLKVAGVVAVGIWLLLALIFGHKSCDEMIRDGDLTYDQAIDCEYVRGEADQWPE
jgi:hypothetical protein